MIVHIGNPCHIVRILIPELSRADSDPLANVLSDDALDQELVPFVLAQAFELRLGFIGDLFAPSLELGGAECLALQFRLHDLLYSLFRFLSKGEDSK